jgi:hypothetical protein
MALNSHAVQSLGLVSVDLALLTIYNIILYELWELLYFFLVKGVRVDG